MYNILIVDDEVEIVDLIEIYMNYESYKVYKAYDGEQALNILHKEKIHLVVLDIMMPKLDGLETLKYIRKDLNLPVILLSAKSENMDKIIGLGTGADDYVTKPFNPMELIARVKAQLRRYMMLKGNAGGDKKKDIISVKDLTIDKASHTVTKNGEVINLTPTEYKLLVLMAENAGMVFSSEDLFFAVWKQKYYESNNTVMVHMWRLREKVEDNAKKPTIIKTVWGVGYKIEKE